MSTATLQITVMPKRILTKKEAAHYCGRAISRFEAECPCAPIKFPNGDLRWDQRDLDKWLDSLKFGSEDIDLSELD